MEEEGEATGGGDGEELQPEFDRDSGPWLKMIEHAEKAFDQWHKTCDNLAKEYANLKRLASSRSDREFQMFYANLEVVKPSIYSRAPQPVAVPRFKDRKPVPRKASEMMERALVTSFDIEMVHETMKRVRDDLALFGRGVVWARYETYEKGEELKECVRYEWVHRKDFLHEPSRFWAETGWVARGTWLTKEQGVKRFGKGWGDDITYEEAKDTADAYQVEKKARVWELWHRGKDLVVWLHPNAKMVLDINAPHLSLEGFFPCPRPAFATLEDDSLVPVPDGCFYKDQLEEINELTARISSLSEALRLVVIYPAGAEGVGEAVEAAIAQTDNRRTWVPVAGLGNLAMQTGGKLSDAIWEMPVDKVAATITQLIALRRELISDVYQISGVSDIMRGETDANETLGAQQLKSQYGSIRIKDRQSEMVRLCDAILNIAGEIMAENFAPQTMISLSQIDLPKQADVLKKHEAAMMQEIDAAIEQVEQGMAQGQPAPTPQQAEQAKQAIVAKHQAEIAEVVTIEKVFALLKAERTRPFVLQIATDSTIQPDENAEKAARSEFATAFAQMSGALAPLMQAAPKEAAPLSGAMLKFVLAPFRAGREMEQVIEEFVDNMTEKANQPPPPNPEAEALMKKAELEGKKLEADVTAKTIEIEDRKAERAEKTKAALEAAALKRDEQMAANADRQAEREHKQQIAAVEKEAKAIDLEMKRLERELKAVEASLRRIEANAKVEEVADRKEDRKFNASQRVEKDAEDFRARKVANDRDQMDLEDREEERQVRRKKSAMMDDEARRVAEDEEMNRQAMEQLAALNQKIEQIGQGLQMVASTQQMLERSITAEKEVVRDPKTGRATGVRLKQANGAR
jgi:hypothetical protein